MSQFTDTEFSNPFKRQRRNGFSTQKITSVTIMPKKAVASGRVYKKKSYKRGGYRKKSTFSVDGDKTKGMPESKYLDTAPTVNPLQAGATLLLNGLVEGLDNINRIGRKVDIKNIQAKLVVYNNTLATTSTPGSEVIRVAIVYDRQPNSALGNYFDVYTGAAAVNTPLYPRSVNNIGRFRVLKEELIYLDTAGGASKTIDFWMPCDLLTRYDGTGATVADISSGCLFLAYGSSNAVGAAQSTMTGYIRINFTD